MFLNILMFFLNLFPTGRKLVRYATRDELTGVYRRWCLFHHCKKYSYKKEQFSLVYVDLDDFKLVNDTHGHFIGDCFLSHFAECLMNFFPDAYIVRIGGDEFVLVFHEYKVNGTTILMLDLRPYFKNNPFISEDNSIILEHRFSFGVASTEEELWDIDGLLLKADGRLYERKRIKKVRKNKR